MPTQYTIARDIAYREALSRLKMTARYRHLQRHKAVLDQLAYRLEEINLRDADYGDGPTPTPREVREALISLAKLHRVPPHERLWRDPVEALLGVHGVQAVVHYRLVQMRRNPDHIKILDLVEDGEVPEEEDV
jgi:hypothetical protein